MLFKINFQNLLKKKERKRPALQLALKGENSRLAKFWNEISLKITSNTEELSWKWYKIIKLGKNLIIVSKYQSLSSSVWVTINLASF